MKRALTASIVTVVLPMLPVGGTAAEDACDVQAPRVVAVGDVHGAYDNLVEVLRMAGLVDADAHWTGGTAHLVQTGDVTDRGEDTRKVLDLLMRLEKEAKKAGGRVHALLGNHEVMNILGDLRYVNPAEYESFRTADSARRLQRLYRNEVDRARDRARATGKEFDEGAYRKKLEAEAPLGFVERARAFHEKGEYGRWLRGLNTVARINGVVFLHGGLTPDVAALGCRIINNAVRRELTDDIELTRRDPLKRLSTKPAGPLWDRSLAHEDETAYASSVDEVLGAMDARAIVVAHTVTKTGRIQDRFGGRVFLIDVGMSPAYLGRLAALEVVVDGTITALYPDRRAVLWMPGPESPPATGQPAVAAQP